VIEIVTIKIAMDESSKQQLDKILRQRKIDVNEHVSECLQNLLIGTAHSPLMIHPHYADEEMYPLAEEQKELI